MKFLNEIEKNEIQKFVKNETLLEAVKKVLLSGIYYQGVLTPGEKANPSNNFVTETAKFALQQNPQIDDAVLGRELRTNVAAIRLIELGFIELAKMKETEDKPKEANPAR